MRYNQKNTTTSETYTNNTTCDREEETFQVDNRLYGRNKYMEENCMAAMVNVPKGAGQSKPFLHQLYLQTAKARQKSLFDSNFVDTLPPPFSQWEILALMSMSYRSKLFQLHIQKYLFSYISVVPICMGKI